jgi:hypothetical protein
MMFRKLTKLFLLALSVASLSSCIEENPTEVGDVLLPSGDVISFEILLPASSFLVWDSSFTGYSKVTDAQFAIIARKFENTVDANMLTRFGQLPSTIVVRNTTTNTAVTDSAPKYFTGRLVLKFDTLVTPLTRPVLLRLFPTTEEWDVSATWTNRVDTGSVHLPWTTPGGTRGASVDTATWAAGDSVVLRVDSQTIALWNDTTNKGRGALIVAETNNTRVKVLSTAFRVSARSSVRADTVVNIDLNPIARTYVFNPTPSAAGVSGIRAGGTPSWRAFVRLRSDLTSLTFPCPDRSNCTVALDSVNLSSAQLLLKPVRPPLGFAPEDSMYLDVRGVSTSAGVPLSRSPLGNRISASPAISPTLFINPTPAGVVKIDITSFIAHLTDKTVKEADRLPPAFALIQLGEPFTFGFATFDAAPTLRLVLTKALERNQ